MDARRLIVVDECGSNVAPLAAVCQSPQRGASTRQRAAQSWQEYHQAFLLIGGGPGACMVMEGAVNAAAFEAYLEHILVPTLSAGQIVVMDKSPCPQRSAGTSPDRGAWLSAPLFARLFSRLLSP